jgi:hypothetical protein
LLRRPGGLGVGFDPVAGTVVHQLVGHQLCHAALGNRSHGAPFRALTTATGLVGKMTQTIEGPLFLAIMPGIIDRIWPLTTFRATPDPWAREDKRHPSDQDHLPRVRLPGLRGAQRWLRAAVPKCRNPRFGNYGDVMEIG